MAMVRRLLASLKLHGRPLADARPAIIANELDYEAALWARELVQNELVLHGAEPREAQRLARAWVVHGDYLLSSARAPRGDIVVGNPPYIRYDDLPEGFFAQYRTVCS